MTMRDRLLGLLALTLAAWTAPAAFAAPSFSLVDPQLALPPGKLEGRSTMLLSIAGASEDEVAGKPENIVDLPVDDAIQGAISFTATPLFGNAKERKWLLTAELKGLPLDTVQKRYLKFSFAGQEIVLAYEASNKGASSTPFSWNLSGPTGELSLSEGQPVQLTISVGPVAATKVRFVPPLFVEQSRHALLQSGWLFCDRQLASPTSQQCPGNDRTIQANTTQSFWAYPPTTLVGKFAGSFSVLAAEKPAGETLTLTLLTTTLRQQLTGIGLLLAGVVLAWLVMVLFQRKASHDQLLLPALEIDAHIQELQADLRKAPAPVRDKMKKTAIALDELSKSLKPSRLERLGLPILIPRLGVASATVQDYQAKIASLAKQADALDVIVRKGLQRAWEAFAGAHQVGKDQVVLTAIHDIDELSPNPALDPGKAFQDCIAILKIMEGALGIGGAQPSFDRTVEKVRAELRSLSLWAWILFGIVSSAAGSYILVLNNPSFGTTVDYFLCVLWGFGLPAGGSQLTQLSVGNLAGVFGFQLPRTT